MNGIAIGGDVSRIWEMSSVSLEVSVGFLLVCDKMQLQVVYDRSMQLAADMCLEGQCVNPIPQELHWNMALIYSNNHFYFFLTQRSCYFERKCFLLFITVYILRNKLM